MRQVNKKLVSNSNFLILISLIFQALTVKACEIKVTPSSYNGIGIRTIRLEQFKELDLKIVFLNSDRSRNSLKTNDLSDNIKIQGCIIFSEKLF